MRLTVMSVLLAAIASFGGCSRPGGLATGTVSGTVRLRGGDISTGTRVVFVNLETGFTCYGETTPDGRYRLNSRNQGRIPIGAFAAMIRPPEPPLTSQAPSDAPVMLHLEFPKKYAELGASGLRFDVQPGPNEFPIDLRAD